MSITGTERGLYENLGRTEFQSFQARGCYGVLEKARGATCPTLTRDTPPAGKPSKVPS